MRKLLPLVFIIALPACAPSVPSAEIKTYSLAEKNFFQDFGECRTVEELKAAELTLDFLGDDFINPKNYNDCLEINNAHRKQLTFDAGRKEEADARE